MNLVNNLYLNIKLYFSGTQLSQKYTSHIFTIGNFCQLLQMASYAGFLKYLKLVSFIISHYNEYYKGYF